MSRKNQKQFRKDKTNGSNGNHNGNSHNSKHEKREQVTTLQKNIILGLILLLTFILFSGSIMHQFVYWDDNSYVTDNPLIRDFSWKGMVNIFSTPVIGMYNPLPFVLYAIDYKFWGLNPMPYHLFNVIFHLINVIITFNFIYLLSKRIETATIVALFFAIHPMHVGTVCWVSTTKSLLFVMFYMLALISYYHYITKNYQIKYMIYTVLLFIPSVLSKPSAVTLPLVLFAMDYYLTRKIEIKLFLEKVPFLIVSLIIGLVTIFTHKVAGDSIFEAPHEYSFINKIFLSNYSIVFYFKKLVWPANLCAIYPYPESGTLLPLKYYLLILVIPFIIFLIIKSKSFRKEMVFGMLFFIFSISVVIRFVPSGFFSAANRYSYLSYTGLFYIIGQYYVWIKDGRFSYSKKIKQYVIPFLAISTIACSIITFQRVSVWQNSLTLFDDIIEKHPNLAQAYNNRAIAKKNIQDSQGAIEDFTKAIEINYKYAEAYNNRGEIKRMLNDTAGALKDYNIALAIKPKYAEALNNKGIIKLNQNRIREAMVNFNSSIAIDPKHATSYRNRGILKLMMKDTAQALADFHIALKLGNASSENLIKMISKK